MSKRFKVKLLSFIVIASIGLTAGFFFSGLINFALTGLRLPGTEADALESEKEPSYYFIRKSMADEMDHKKWDSRITTAIICCIGVVSASLIINVLVSYYQ